MCFVLHTSTPPSSTPDIRHSGSLNTSAPLQPTSKVHPASGPCSHNPTCTLALSHASRSLFTALISNTSMNGHSSPSSNGNGSGLNGLVSSTLSLLGNGNGTGTGNGSNGSHAHRSLLVIHKPSNTRLSIDNVPETLLGFALDLKDEFLEHLNESGKGDKLVAEAAPQEIDEDDEEAIAAASSSSAGPLHNAQLFLASYWLEFITPKHDIATPILQASRDYFAAVFLVNSTLDIHSIAGKLSDTDDKKLVLRSWINACAKLGSDFGPTGKIWDEKSATSIYAVFGGQGSNEYFFDEFEVSFFSSVPSILPISLQAHPFCSCLSLLPSYPTYSTYTKSTEHSSHPFSQRQRPHSPN